MFITIAIHIYFTSLAPIFKLPFFQWISLETKILPLMSQDAFLFGHPVYFDYQDFLSFASNFPFQVLMEENYEKCCNLLKSPNTLYDLIT